jgi:hypothetical protein
VPDQLVFFDADSRNDAVEAGVMLRPFRNSRERMRIDADHPPPTHDPVNARHLPMQVTARIVETAADPTGEGVEIEMLAAPAARRAFKLRPRLLVHVTRMEFPLTKMFGVCLASW